ncbi:MAG: hypothetical protein LBE27_01825 [Deltaproteobacteria bacterium]|jgi:hypothetical protein|nr:hypothetical protein [Deltaproteobacteria bacterium]
MQLFTLKRLISLLLFTISTLGFTPMALCKDFLLLTGLGAEDPLMPLMEDLSQRIASKEGWMVETQSFESDGGILAAAKLSLSDPDGLTLAFLSLDTVETKSLLGHAPYRDEHFQPLVLGFERGHALITHKNTPFASLSGIKLRVKEPMLLLTDDREPLSTSTLLALDIMDTLKIPVRLKQIELPPEEMDGSDGERMYPGSNASYAEVFSNATEGNLLALPLETLSYFQERRIPFVVVAILTDHPQESPLYPDSAFLESSGLTLRIHDYHGFFYVSETLPRLMEDVPGFVRESCLNQKYEGLPYMDPLLFGEEALDVFLVERDRRAYLIRKAQEAKTR